MTEQEEKRKRPESGMSAGVTAALIALLAAVGNIIMEFIRR